MAPPSQPTKHAKGNQKGEGAKKRAAEHQESGTPPTEVEDIFGASSSAVAPDLQARFNTFTAAIATRIGSLESAMSCDMGQVSASLDGAITKMADRMEWHEKHSLA